MRDGHNRNPLRPGVTGCAESGAWRGALQMQPTIMASSAPDGEDCGGRESRTT